MMPARSASLLFVGALACSVLLNPRGPEPAQPRHTPLATQTRLKADRGRLAATLAHMPVRFEQNVGQHDASVRYVARTSRATLALRDDGATLSVKAESGTDTATTPVVIAMRVEGGRPVTPRASQPLITKVHDFRGAAPSRWRSDIPTFAEVTYPSVRDGVDLVYHGETGLLEYDFVVAPGTNVEAIAMEVTGASRLSLTSRGELSIRTLAGELLQPPPIAYQLDASGERHLVSSHYRLVGNQRVGFEVSAYDVSRPLVVDPLLSYSSYLGGTAGELVGAVALDSEGNALVAGTTASANLATAGAFSGTCAGCPAFSDAFISKLDPTGTHVLFTSYLGGDADDAVHALAVGSDDTVYVAGTTESSDFPTVNPVATRKLGSDAFVARLSADGSALSFSTYLSGDDHDDATAIAVTSTGIYVSGTTHSHELLAIGEPIPPFPRPQKLHEDVFIVKLKPNGSAFDYRRIFGGSGSDAPGTTMAVDAQGRAYLTGHTDSSDFPQTAGDQSPGCQRGGHTDAFFARIDATGAGVDFATCFGGSRDDAGRALALDNAGAVYIGGDTSSGDFPLVGSTRTHAGLRDGFVTKIDVATSTVVYSTLLGGSQDDSVTALGIDAQSTAWVTGLTYSADFPTANALEPTLRSASDAFLARLDPAGGTLLFSSFFGGATGIDAAAALAVRGSKVQIGGYTSSTDLPISGAAQPSYGGSVDGFVAQFSNPPLLLAPKALALPVGYTQQFVATGGAGGYVFSMVTNASGATLSNGGLYTSGALPNTTDVIRVADELGVSTTATILVGTSPPSLALTPASTSVPPRGTRAFVITGGVSPITFGFTSNASGAVITGAGTYTAGSAGGVTDIVRATDALGTIATARVSVGPSIAISPPAPAIPPRGTVAFSASGGAGSPFSWSLDKSGSGAILDQATGAYKAGSIGNTTDTVRVTDALGNQASVSISVGSGLTVIPASVKTTPRGATNFSATGGLGPFVWSLGKSSSMGFVDPQTGAYRAGPVGDSIDILRVTDSLGSSAQATIEVGPSLSIVPNAVTLAAGTTQAFGAAGGSGSGYVYAMLGQASSGGTVTSGGVYVAGANAGTDRLSLKDSLGNEAIATITVLARVSTPLPDSGLTPDAGAPANATTDPELAFGGGGAAGCACRSTPAPKPHLRDLALPLAGLLFAIARRTRKA